MSLLVFLYYDCIQIFHLTYLWTMFGGSGVSVWTCSKLCVAFFVAGVFVGYTLKRRVRRWASKLLRKIKDD